MIKQATQNRNVNVHNLRSRIGQRNHAQVDYLVIAHNDAGAIDQLKQAFRDNTLAVVVSPQGFWGMDDESDHDLVHWAITELRVKGILLVGHSRGGTPDDQFQLVSDTTPEGPAEQSANRQGCDALWQRIRHAEARVARCEQHFAKHLECLRNQANVESRRASRPVPVQGLFYRAECGVFCLYDSATGAFQAVTP